MAIRRPHISIITLNVNGLNSPVKRHRVAEWIRKQNSTICCLLETYLSSKGKYSLKVRGCKMIFQANGIQRKVRVAVLIAYKIDFKVKKVKKGTEGHFIMIKRIIHQEDITLINIYAPNQRAPKYVNLLLRELKGETDQNTNIVGNLNTPLLDMERSSKQKIYKEIISLNDTSDQLYVIDIYRAFHPKTAAYAFFSSAHGTFSRIDHILGHRDKLNKYKRFEILPAIVSDHNAWKLEINCKTKMRRTTNTWRLNNMLLKDDWVREEIKREIEKYIEMNDNNSTTYQNFWNTAKVVIRGKFISLQTYLQSLKDYSMTQFPSPICKIVHPVKTMKIIDNATLLFLLSCAGKLYICTMEYYLVMRKNEILPFVMTWMNLYGIILSEISHTEKDKYHMISLLCRN
ncbi:LINE-1 reverse transcriptase like protein [Pteropus alecto]|uniref:exodeoxyribonuclease III n=1 Tax=Pteropus alecto TaxID=9402 RepID=L5KQS1_PTEAL|nr:LINE-1 reverse transcriptase like protein [Pteropus alecto]